MNRNGPSDQNGSPSTNDFPPLARNGNDNTGTHAEPMQVERAKTRPSGSSAWNGVGPKPLGQIGIGGTSSSSPAHEMSPTSPRANMLRTPAPLVPSPKTPMGASALSPNSAGLTHTGSGDAAHTHAHSDRENDFPRRAPSMNSSQTLFDPSASVPTPTSATSASRPGSTVPVPVPIDESSMSPEEIIEAKLAAISLREGVVIGPPPSKENGNGNGTPNGPAPSYARIVKRD